jgi:hypothetical protein
MIEFILGVVVVLLAGYVIANNHHRIRSLAVALTTGTMVGDALPIVPDDVECDHGPAHHYPNVDDGYDHVSNDGDADGHS